MGFAFSVQKVFPRLFLALLLLDCFVNLGSEAQSLPLDEVKTLQTIFEKLQNKTVNVGVTSCTDGRWNFNASESESKITCDCSFNASTVCHVTNIQLKGFSLAGTFPAEFGNLTQLREIDLSRNFLSGSIPTSLTRIPLAILSVLANRLNGTIPSELGDVSTLDSVNLEDNLFSGPLPANLGKLSSLTRLLLSANNFTGSIPESFSNLKNLTDFRIDGSNLSGKIPEFIGNWTRLGRLDLQGTSMEGPIPNAISSLNNLTELRISDLTGPASPFPDLEGMTKMKRLILRNCLMTGSIPDYIGSMSALKLLDLSSNMLKGTIPETFQNLDQVDFMFLTNNSLTGRVPQFILDSKKNIDISYNNFTQPPAVGCNSMTSVNLVSSFSSTNNNLTPWCLRKDLSCPRKANGHSLFINCGGRRTVVGKNTYEEDLSGDGPSTFNSLTDWGYSSTGLYVGDDKAKFVATNQFGLNLTGPDYYRTARVAPQSLKYYGLCMQKGSYKVQLHFAEIMYSNDQTFRSLGRRIFDISIQGRLVRKNFNIAEEAGGVGKEVTKEFDGIIVNGSTLEIHLHWSGKGTNAVPDRGVYGPLISAITITPNFKVDTGGLSAGQIAGIVAGSIALVGLILFFLWKKGCLGGKGDEENELRGLDLQTGYFTLKQIKAATNNFDPANKIGEGGFGPVYKGVLSDGVVIAVKQLSSKSKQGNREFLNEIGMISAIHHPNLVKLYGCCIEGKELLLVYEYLENNSLARALFGSEEQKLHLDWSTRNKVCIGIAKGLAYLHEESRLKIVHRDIKATNVLLDKALNAKISDFGLAKLDEEENTHISTRIAGTIGYMAPEYAMRGYLTDKADVYSFGIVCLEIVSGKSNTNYRPKEEFVYLLDWAYVLEEQGNLLELVDPDLGSNYKKQDAMRMLEIALLCTNPSPTLRPSMSSVVGMLEGKLKIEPPLVKRGGGGPDARFKAFELLSQDSQTQTQTQMQGVSTFSRGSHAPSGASVDGGPWIDSSASLTSQEDASREYSSSIRLIGD